MSKNKNHGGILKMDVNHFATDVLLESGINRFPITPHDIEKILKDCGWKVFKYDLENENDVTKLKNWGVLETTKLYKAFSLKKNNIQIVFYHAGMSVHESAYALAHELGHIKYGHFSETGILGHHSDNTYDKVPELEAEEFARAFLAPYCILKKLHATSVDDITKYTTLEIPHAKIRAGEIKINNHKLKPEEYKLINNFGNYIKEHSQKQIHKNNTNYIHYSVCNRPDRYNLILWHTAKCNAGKYTTGNS